MKKGFTLIEVLATLIVVGIIGLITIPVITGVVEKTRLNALKSSAYGLLEASNIYFAEYEPNKITRFDIKDSIATSSNTINKLKFKGVVKEGTVIIDKKGKTTICITDGKNSAYKNYNETRVTLVTKNKCYVPNNTSVVYLEKDGRTITELTNQELTDKIAELEALLAKKANQSDLEIVSSVANNAQEKANSAATASNLETVATIASSKTTLTEALDKAYPIGSIYITISENTAEKVHNKLGGTWVAWGSGRVPVGVNGSDSSFNTVEKTGGEKTHTLTGAESGQKNLGTLTTGTESRGHTHSIPALSGSTNKTGSHYHSMGSHSHSIWGFYNDKYGRVRQEVLFQADGNVVIRDHGGSSTPRWNSGTNGAGPSMVVNQHGGNVTINGYTAGTTESTSLGNTGSAGDHSHTVTTTASTTGGISQTHTHSLTIGASNATNAHNNLQPYITAYMWKRTA